MALDLFSLDASPLSLKKNDIAGFNATKVSSSQVKADFSDKLEQGKVTAVIEQNSLKQLEIGSPGKTDPRSEGGSYPSDLFFMSKQSDKVSSGSVVIDGVSFSNTEFKACNDLMLQCRQDLRVKPFWDYEDYAKQSLVQSAVDTFAKNNLSSDQASVLNKAFSGYLEALSDYNKSNLENGNIAASDFSDQVPYYDKFTVMTQKEADTFNQAFSENGFFKSNFKAGTKTVLQQATNQDLVAKMQTLFASLDLNDDDAVNQSVSAYQKLIEPVFSALNGKQGAYSSARNSADSLKQLAKSYRNMISAHIDVRA